MLLTVNHQLIPESAIADEIERLALDPHLAGVPDPALRAAKTREAAEHALISSTLVEQRALADRRPIDPALIYAAVEREKARSGCRSAFDDSRLRAAVETELRIDRTIAELVADAPHPTPEDVRTFFVAHGHNFRSPEMFHAAHIVKHVNENQSETVARAAIEQALLALAAGESFVSVADRFSDCTGNGGDLGVFPRGSMVPEFEDVLDHLEPGQRSGIFTTPFGFHIALLHSKYTDGLADFESVRPDIERVLTTAAEHQTFLAAIRNLEAAAEIRRTRNTAA